GLRLVQHLDDPRPAGDLRQLVQRVLREAREAGDDVVLLGRACSRHGAIVPRYAGTVTGVPARVRAKSLRSMARAASAVVGGAAATSGPTPRAATADARS